MDEQRNGAEVILEVLRMHGTECVFASPIAVMAPVWEALARRGERGTPAVAFEPRPAIDPQPVMAAPAQLDEIAALLVAGDSPLIITEHGGRSEAEVAALTRLAELLGAPVFEPMLPSYHNVPRTHPLCMLGPVEPVLEQADVILIAGANAPWHPPQPALRSNCTVIHLEEDPLRPRSAYWGYRTTHAVAGERLLNLQALVERVRQRRAEPPAERTQRWHAYKQRAREQGRRAANAALGQGSDAVPAAALFQALHAALPESSIIVDEIVAQAPQMIQFLFESKPFRQSRGWVGALGTGLGTALGAKLARPDRTVVCVVGDGVLHYNPVPAALLDVFVEPAHDHHQVDPRQAVG